MPHAIYSGEGTYDGTLLMAVYNAYLPDVSPNGYEFKTDIIYNLSCTDYPNTILMFMRVANATNTDLRNSTADGNTEEKATTILFSLEDKFIEDIDTTACIGLDPTKDINMILFHDVHYSTTYVKDNIFCKAPSTCETAPLPIDDEEGGLESPVVLIPKVGKMGIIKLKPKSVGAPGVGN